MVVLAWNSRILKADWEFSVPLRRYALGLSVKKKKNTERKRRGEGRRKEKKSNLWIVFFSPSQQGLTKSCGYFPSLLYLLR